jgi:hypothetical protein
MPFNSDSDIGLLGPKTSLMESLMSPMNQLVPARVSSAALPALVAAGGAQAAERFIEFFTSNIRNRHTREAYARAVNEFMRWCEAHGVRSLTEVKSLHVAT